MTSEPISPILLPLGMTFPLPLECPQQANSTPFHTANGAMSVWKTAIPPTLTPFPALGSHTKPSLSPQLFLSSTLTQNLSQLRLQLPPSDIASIPGDSLMLSHQGCLLTQLNDPPRDSLPPPVTPSQCHKAPDSHPSGTLDSRPSHDFTLWTVGNRSFKADSTATRGTALACQGPLGLPTPRCKLLQWGFNLDNLDTRFF